MVEDMSPCKELTRAFRFFFRYLKKAEAFISSVVQVYGTHWASPRRPTISPQFSKFPKLGGERFSYLTGKVDCLSSYGFGATGT
jgi:hypothetical protein